MNIDASEAPIQMFGSFVLKITSRLPISSEAQRQEGSLPGGKLTGVYQMCPLEGGGGWTRAQREQPQEAKAHRWRVGNAWATGSEVALLLVRCETLNKSFSLWGPQKKGLSKDDI